MIAIGCSGPATGTLSNQSHAVDPPPPPEPPTVAGSPGPLAIGHADLDAASRCENCHAGNSSEIVNVNCLGCHDKLAARMRIGRGFHASNLVTGKSCGACHKDHRGRRFDLRGWAAVGGEARFDHKLTGWPLTGKHASVASCVFCHTGRDRQGLTLYVGTDSACVSCHSKAQPHRMTRRALLACDRCHTTAIWKPVKAVRKFDHDNRSDAAMPLLGAHRTVACAKCHPRMEFALPATTCESCHAKASPHANHLFAQRPCAACHPTVAWKQPKFDHSKTKLDLGVHRMLACTKCHSTALATALPPAACEGCHAAKSPHARRFAAVPACATCHTQSWRSVTFDHAKPLPHRHGELGCRACHRGANPATFEDLKAVKGCKGCHAHATVHADDQHPKGKYTDAQCLHCHVIGSERRPTSIELFHGARGEFPLTKKHKMVPCMDCHTARTTKGRVKFEGLSRECVTCHADYHQGRRGKTCTPCHQGGTWDVPGP